MTNNLKIIEDLIPVEDFAFLYGFSIFETFLVNENSKIFLLEKHIDRFLNSITFFKIETSYTKEDILSLITKYIADNKLSNCILRLTITAGNKGKGIKPKLYFSIRDNNYTLEKISFGSKLQVSNIRKSETSILLKHKTSNYLENYFILQNAINRGYDDAILLNSLNNFTETTKCNLFFVKDNKLYTPDLNGGVLPGILRSWVIDTAKKNNIDFTDGHFKIENLYSSDEVFITNSVIGIMHVRSIEEMIINNGDEGQITGFFKDKLIFDSKIYK